MITPLEEILVPGHDALSRVFTAMAEVVIIGISSRSLDRGWVGNEIDEGGDRLDVLIGRRKVDLSQPRPLRSEHQ